MIPQMNSPLEQLDSTAIRDFVACPYCRRITPTQKLTVLKLQDWVGTCQLRCPECNILLAKTYALQIPSWLAKFSLLASLFPIGLFIRLFYPTFLYCTLLFWLVAAVCWYYRADHVYHILQESSRLQSRRVSMEPQCGTATSRYAHTKHGAFWLRVKKVKDAEALKAMQAVYETRGWRIVQINTRIEAYDKKTGQLKGIAQIANGDE